MDHRSRKETTRGVIDISYSTALYASQYPPARTMHPKQHLAVYVGTAAAIDVYISSGYDCQGSYSLCRNLPPNECCGVVHNFATLAFLGIPTNWDLELRSHKKYEC